MKSTWGKLEMRPRDAGQLPSSSHPDRTEPTTAWKHTLQQLVKAEGGVWVADLKEAGPCWTLLAKKVERAAQEMRQSPGESSAGAGDVQNGQPLSSTDLSLHSGTCPTGQGKTTLMMLEVWWVKKTQLWANLINPDQRLVVAVSRWRHIGLVPLEMNSREESQRRGPPSYHPRWLVFM